MLVALELTDFAIIDALRVEFAPGLNVLTGETGAGKSILIDALALLIGGRADSGMIRAGAEGALIQGEFAGTGISSVSRRLQRTGRSTARLDGEIVTVSELGRVGAEAVAIHGQHASQTLLEASEQRRLLDRLLPKEARETLQRFEATHATFKETDAEIERLRTATRERLRRLDLLQYQRDEIDAARLREGEEAELQREVEGLRHAERITLGAGRALDTLSEAEVNAVDLVAGARRDLEGAGRYHETLEALAGELAEALSGLQAIGEEVRSFLADFEVEPGRLERLEARLALLEGLKLKYGDSVEAVLAYREELQEELDTLQNAETNLETLSKRREALSDELETLADVLSGARTEAARRLSEGVTSLVRPLGMDNANFSVRIERLPEFAAHGRDRVTFLFSANLGEPLSPLSAVASGGELSRVMLGLNVATGAEEPTLAFDEVDAGIGGGTARAVGALLKRLACDRQVLVVTHLPQVAAFADAQFRVEKLEQEGRTVTKVTRLEAAEREAELARMLSGVVTKTARAHARELLQEVGA